MIEIKGFFHPPTATVSYLIWDAETRQAALIDPVLDYDQDTGRTATQALDAVLSEASSRDLKLVWGLETHAHADHLSAAHVLAERTGARIGIGARITEVQKAFAPLFLANDVKPDGSAFDALFEDGEEIALGRATIKVLHTPGHTPACVSYHVGDAVFVGDTLFMPDFGTARTDFPGGDAATLYRSIRRLLDLPAATRMFVGHDYPPPERDAPAWRTSVAEQRAGNIHVHDGVSEEEYVAMRNARDASLAAPRLILPSLQINIRAGAMPPPESDGHIYLKIPLNRFGS